MLKEHVRGVYESTRLETLHIIFNLLKPCKLAYVFILTKYGMDEHTNLNDV